MDIRNAESSELDCLTQIWHDGWQDAHAQILPAGLARFRTLPSFRERMQIALPNVRTAGPLNAPVGFHLVKGDELDQLYVSAASRGSGIASALIADAEARLRASGVTVAWLACAIGNQRAARFYERSGWRCAGPVMNELATPEGPFWLKVWRYEKDLSPP